MKKATGILFAVTIFFAQFALTACGTDTFSNAKGTGDGLPAMPDLTGSFVPGTDDQPDSGDNTVYTGEGCYTLRQTDNDVQHGWLLMYEDAASGLQVPVCGKADCSHETEDCNAYFEETRYPLSNIWYYLDSVYLFCVEEDYYAIEKVPGDGAKRSISCRLYRTGTDAEMDDDGTMVIAQTYYPELALHRGYAYFSSYYPGAGECGLYRVRLDSSEGSELLCTQEGEYPILYRLKGYGNGLYFQKGNFENQEGTEVDISLFAWNIDTGTITEVAENVVRNYTIGNGGVYYFDLEDFDSVMKYTPETKETVMLVDSHGEAADIQTELFVRGHELYYSLPTYQIVYDDNGAEVQRLKGADMVVPYETNQ